MLKTNLLISKNPLRCGANCPCQQVWHLMETVSSVGARSTSHGSVWFVKSFATTGADEIGGPQDEARLSWGVAESRWEVQALLLIFENHCDFNFLHQTTFKLLWIEMIENVLQRAWKVRDVSQIVSKLEGLWDEHATQLWKAASRSQLLWRNPRLWRGPGGGSQVWSYWMSSTIGSISYLWLYYDPPG